MGRVIYYTSASLDGFLADACGGMEWLFRHENDPNGSLGWNEFDAHIGAIVMGRTTYDWVAGELRRTGSNWPHSQPCWVVTSRPVEPLEGADLRRAPSNPKELISEALEAAGATDVWCAGGGRVAAWLHAAGLIDEVWVTLAPELLGNGVPLLPVAARLELVEHGRNGEFLTARYRVVRDADNSA